MFSLRGDPSGGPRGAGAAAADCEEVLEFPMTEPKKSYVPTIDPPDEVTRGLREGFSQLDRRAWLEVLDPKHRYAKHLRAYYQAWDLLDRPGSDFLSWLDTAGFELDSCPRSVLEADTVHYCSEEEREQYAIDIEGGRVWFRGGDRRPVDTGSKGWIFVVRDGVVYAAEKRTEPPRFHHSSFFSGQCVEVAGLLVARDGWVRRVFPHSGHYRPGDTQIMHLLKFLDQRHLDLSSVEVDAQHTMKVARLLRREGNKMKKTDCPHFMRGDALLHFLERKFSAWSTPLFNELVERRTHSSSADHPRHGSAGQAHGLASAHPPPADRFDYHQTISHSRPSCSVALSSVFEDVDAERYDPAGWGTSPPEADWTETLAPHLRSAQAATVDAVAEAHGRHGQDEDDGTADPWMSDSSSSSSTN